ncbi:MAG: helicase-associated domain-containing protein [Microbacteriaceae bacterium]
MPATSSSALALAARLRHESDEELAALLRARDVRDTGIRDYFDLAEKLLEPASVHTALAQLDRPTLATLAVLAEFAPPLRPTVDDVTARLLELGAVSTEPAATLAASAEAHVAHARRSGLIDVIEGRITLFDAVATALAGWPALHLPGLQQLVQPAPATLGAVSRIDAAVTDSASADRAFATTNSVGELVAALDHAPARELSRGGIALPDSRRLAEAAGVSLDEVPALHSIAAHAGLIALDAGHWLPTDDAAEWMLQPSASRWAHLAEAWLHQLPHDIRSLLSGRAHTLWGDRFDDYLEWYYPAGGDWMRARVDTHTHAATLLGIVADQVPSTPGAALLSAGASAAASAMLALFPHQITSVYIQHDLSIVSPGPLEPHRDARLRALATVENRALATTYRVSAASLNRALAAGETAQSLTAFLESISLTGIPQPLAYLIAESAGRYGLLRVGELPVTGDAVRGPRSYIRSSDETLLRTVRVDHSLAALGFTAGDDGRLTSRFDRATVFWALSDARYPVAAESTDGAITVLERGRTARPHTATAKDPAAAIVEKLRLLARDEPAESSGTAWVQHQLEVAIRAKITVAVTVTIQDGTSVTYTVQPTSLAGGRLRALDRLADIERTLPLTHIESVGSPD